MAMAQVISTHHLFKQLKEVGFEKASRTGN